MDPARYILSFNDSPRGLLERLRAELDAQGLPAILARRSGAVYEFEAATGLFMLRARVADALTTVWPDWQAAVSDSAERG